MSCSLIKPKNSCYYHAKIKLPSMAKATTHSLKCKHRQVAVKLMNDLYAELEREAAGIGIPKAQKDAAKKPIAQHLDDMLEAKTTNRDGKYLAELKAKILRLEKECRWQNAVSITPESFLLWRAKQMQVISPKTLNEYLIAIRSLLNWMVSRGRLIHCSLASVEMLPVYKQVNPRRALTDDELSRLVKVSGQRGLLYLFAAFTGLRYGEVKALRVCDLNLDAAFLIARAETTKNGHEAPAPLPLGIVEALRSYIEKQGFQPSGLLFPLMSRKHFPEDAEAAGIPLIGPDGLHVGFHSLRHTFCTWLQRGGVNQRVLMQLMRHSDRRLSDHLYTTASLLPTREAVGTLPKFENELRQILRQELVPSRPELSSDVPSGNSGHAPESLINKGPRLELSQIVPLCPKTEMVRDAGFEPATSCV